MVAGNALPPVPAVFGTGWREQWERRVDDAEPWLLRWIEEQVDGPYWRHGSVRPDYDRIACRDDDRGRLGRRLHEHRLPRLRGALVPEARDPRALGARLDRHRAAGAAHRPRPGADPLVPPLARRTRRTASTTSRRSRCSPAARPCRRRIAPRCAASGAARRPGHRSGSREQVLRPEGDGVDTIHVRGDVGRMAWISCAGRLPWGLPDDQRVDDALSLTYDWEPLAADLDVMGHPRVRLTVTSPVPVAYVSAKLCDVFPDGTSALAGRGLLNLTHRSGHDAPLALEPGVPDRGRDRARGDLVDLRAGPPRAARRSPAPTGRTSGRRRAAHRCRSTGRASSSCCRCSTAPRRCPRRCCRRRPARTRTHRTRPTSSLRPSGDSRTTRSATSRAASRDPARTTRHRSAGGSRSGTRARRASRRTTRHSAWARGRTTYRITWPEADVRTEATLDVRSDAEAYHVVITLIAEELGPEAG